MILWPCLLLTIMKTIVLIAAHFRNSDLIKFSLYLKCRNTISRDLVGRFEKCHLPMKRTRNIQKTSNMLNYLKDYNRYAHAFIDRF